MLRRTKKLNFLMHIAQIPMVFFKCALLFPEKTLCYRREFFVHE